MSIWKYYRNFYIKTTDYTHGFQGENKKILTFYRLWAFCYDFSVGLDPAYKRELKNMVIATVHSGDDTLDIGCGTGLGTIQAAAIAKTVTGIDISPNMIKQLERKIVRKRINNIKLIVGGFPESPGRKRKFNSIISSFAIVHFPENQRSALYKNIYAHLQRGGRLGLFSAQGEIAPTFEKKDEIAGNLTSARFKKIEIDDVSDIYRIVRAQKT